MSHLRDGEAELWSRVKRGDRAARDELVGIHRGLVYEILPNPKATPEYDEFEQAALITLWRAVEAFDPGRGTRFSTYACEAVKKSVAHTWRLLAQGRRFVNVEVDTAGRDMGPLEVMLSRERRHFEGTLSDIVWRLNESDALYLTRKYGLDGEPPMTDEQIGNLMGYTKQRAWQRHHRALDRLRDLIPTIEGASCLQSERAIGAASSGTSRASRPRRSRRAKA